MQRRVRVPPHQLVIVGAVAVLVAAQQASKAAQPPAHRGGDAPRVERARDARVAESACSEVRSRSRGGLGRGSESASAECAALRGGGVVAGLQLGGEEGDDEDEGERLGEGSRER